MKPFRIGRVLFFDQTPMKKIFRILPFLLLSIFTVSCINTDDDSIDGGNYFNQGQVSFDGITLPLTYADFYHKADVQGGEIWTLVLSQEFLGYNTTHSDAYLYLEVFRPNGVPVDGVYDMLHPTKFIDYAAYYEDVMLSNGNPNSYGFYIPNNSFIDGRLNVQYSSGNIHYFEVRLHTYSGEILTAWFEGRLQY